ncbi:MAG: hypothetical protein HYZ28_09255 [Myxococcales bacterium]|nr:hypothetical protein [Myxococcales bacterium]
MSQTRLEELGFTVRDADGSLEAVLPLSTGELVNPLTRKVLTEVTFVLLGERLIVIEPPELVGCPPLGLSRVERAYDVEQHIAESHNENIFHISRRSSELASLNLTPNVDPKTLQLTAEIDAAPFKLVIASDREGNFRVLSATLEDRELPTSAAQAFELSEFRERAALEDYLAALFEAHLPQKPAPPERPDPSRHVELIAYRELVDHFGASALVPPRSALEILVELKAGGASYRFAAVRVAGKIFRGLLAGPKGKVWAERFELDGFCGIRALAADALGVPQDEVELLGGKGG